MSVRYIWRTKNDGKVRSGHASREGMVFSWDNPPEGGHPGESFNCRCTAEEIAPLGRSWVKQEEVSKPSGSSAHKWGNFEFIWHFIYQNGSAVELQNIGLLRDVINRASEIIYSRFEAQIIKDIKENRPTLWSFTFNKPYNFKPVCFSFGDSTVSGVAHGSIVYEGSVVRIKGQVNYEFWDQFTDPIDLIKYYNVDPGILHTLLEFGGTKYDIGGTWDTKITGEIHL